jgi:hypothetical protein
MSMKRVYIKDLQEEIARLGGILSVSGAANRKMGEQINSQAALIARLEEIGLRYLTENAAIEASYIELEEEHVELGAEYGELETEHAYLVTKVEGLEAIMDTIGNATVAGQAIIDQ